jgi:hypothetical protein
MVGVHTSGMFTHFLKIMCILFALLIWFQIYILLNNSCMNSSVGIGGVPNKRIVGGYFLSNVLNHVGLEKPLFVHSSLKQRKSKTFDGVIKF